MRKKNFLWTMAAALAFVSCSQDELLENPTVLEQNAIAFSSYLGDNAQGRAVVMDEKLLGVEGFGVNAYYTGQDNYVDALANGTAEDFMQNTKVTYNKDKDRWEYSPVKYWPNNKGDKVSFFAYGPYAKDGNANNIVLNGTDITFTVADEVKDQVDLIYNDQTIASTTDLEKPAVNTTINFTFGHALARIAFTVEAAVDEVTNGSNLLDGNTRINVKKVVLMEGEETANPDSPTGPFYESNTFSLVNGIWDEPAADAATKGFVFNATDHFYHTVKDVDAETGGQIDVMQLTRFNASEPQRLLNDESYLMVIPQDATFKIYIEYDVISEGNDNDGAGNYDSSAITNKITSKEFTVSFEQGMAYNFNLILGMASVQFDVETVTDWGDPNQEEAWLPNNGEEDEEGDGEEDNDNLVAATYLTFDGEEILIEDANDLAEARNYINANMQYQLGKNGDDVVYYVNVATVDDDLENIGEIVSQYKNFNEAPYRQTADIDLSELETNDDATNWTPIGNENSMKFKGIYNGANYKISSLNITSGTSTTYGVGLFGNAENATFENITISSCSIDQEESPAAAIVGKASECSFTNCVVGSGPDENLCIIKGYGAGGITAYSDNVIFTNCINYAAIHAYSSNASGIGEGSTSEYIGCKNYGSVTLEDTGSLYNAAGISSNSAAKIENCHNYGSIKGAFAAGIVCMNSDKLKIVAASHNEGEIDASYCGSGICSYPREDLTLIGCYNTGEIGEDGYFSAGLIAYPGGGTDTSLREYTMIACYNTGSCVAAFVHYSNTENETNTEIYFTDCYYTTEEAMKNWNKEISGVVQFDNDLYQWYGEAEEDKTVIMDVMNNALATASVSGYLYSANEDGGGNHPLTLSKTDDDEGGE